LRKTRVVPVLLFTACKHVPTEKERQGAQIHFDLGVQAQGQGNAQEALREFETALSMDPDMPEAHNGLGLVLHLSFRHYDQAVEHFRAALAERPDFAEAMTNLGNVYLDREQYDDAIALYRQALNNMRYTTPYIAQSNLGWALYKKGDVAQGIDNIKSAVTLKPEFCMGYRNLGLIYDGQNSPEIACREFGKYREHCPEVADAYYREGICLAKLGKPGEAKERFLTCQSKATADQLRDDCRQLGEKLP
jgi:type IV pilus assembly protein PilF